MSFVYDIFMIIIGVFIVVGCWRKGFVKSVMSLLSLIIATFTAYAFTPSLSEYINEHFIKSRISGTLYDSISGYFSDFSLDKVGEIIKNITNTITRYGSNSEGVSSVITTASENGASGTDAAKSVADFIATPVSTTISNIIAFTLIFFAALILLSFVTFIVDKIFKLPVLDSANKLLGLIFGIIEAILICWVLALIFSVLNTSLEAVAPKYFNTAVVDNSIILKFFSSYNILGMIKDAVKA